MTRQELIDNAIFGVSGLPLSRAQYRVYRDCYHHDPPLPSWEEMVFAQKPWLASDKAFARRNLITNAAAYAPGTFGSIKR